MDVGGSSSLGNPNVSKSDSVDPEISDGVALVDPEASDDYTVQFSQDCSYYVPSCPDELKPVEGKHFMTLDEGIEFYMQYASVCGFVVCLGSSRVATKDNTILYKHLLCNREGFKEGKNNTGKRLRASTRVGCDAHIVLKFAGMLGYVVQTFVERHSHPLVTGKDKQFMKSRRKLDIGHKKFILSCEKANIGPMESHKIYKELVGGYENVGASAIDFKNHKRDLMAYINGSDAQMVIDRFFLKKELCDAFYFAYDVDSSDRLTKLFWADPISRKNFSYFGEVVSFDATYRTNRYCMVFAPFTGLDHHKKCVTFGVGLLLKEDIESFVWLFEHFKKAMGHDPRILVTDQDAAMKVAIERVFPRTRHRLCMWHIMTKVPGKIKTESGDVDEFRQQLNIIVWSHKIVPAEFEPRWLELVSRISSKNRRWFDDMFAIRHFWIPAYFRDEMFGGLVRTTSISEVQNSFFGHFTDRYFRLCELVMHFETAMESQRHTQAKLNHDSTHMVPDLKTPLQLECHAADVYTISVFYEVQKEIFSACFSCCIDTIVLENGSKFFGIKEDGQSVVQVVYDLLNDDVICGCRMFQRIGLPCRHMFVVFKNLGMESIPTKFVLSRWTKAATISPIFTIDGAIVEQCAAIEETQALTSSVISDFYSCLGILEDHPQLMQAFSSVIKEQKEKLVAGSSSSYSDKSVNARSVESLAGISIPSEIHVHQPEQAKNKGSGKRILGARESAMSSSKAGKRRCGKCGKTDGHNIRTCVGK